MLSRFSKLPGISTLLSTSQYPQEAVNNAVAEIKLAGKNVSDNEDDLRGIRKILGFMKRFSESVQVQRVACHALSNLAMQVISARWIVQHGGFQLIKKAMMRFHADHKMCWLASSAVWNLARPPANRSVIGRDGVKLMLQILYEHRNREKVTNTAIGALSNLSLQDNLKDIIAQPENLEMILAVMTQHLSSSSVPVMTSGAGLLANLAVSDVHAGALVQKKALNVLMKLLSWDVTANEETLYRNTCAALNNLVTADHFVDYFLRARGVEVMFDFLEHNDNELYRGLLENCLTHLDADSSVKTTSLHLACFHGRLDVLKALHRDEPDVDLDGADGRHMTPLDYAISQGQQEVANFLSLCGASKHTRTEMIDHNVYRAIEKGKDTYKHAVETHQTAMIDALPSFPTDLAKHLVQFQSRVDMLKTLDLY